MKSKSFLPTRYTRDKEHNLEMLSLMSFFCVVDLQMTGTIYIKNKQK